MKQTTRFFSALHIMTAVLFLSLAHTASAQVHKLKVQDMEDNPVSLAQYKGKVLLIVNTATHCGFTPQYKELQELYDRYKNRGFEILDFPCNQFKEQAPGSMADINKFCTEHYATTFPRFNKIDVNGPAEAPLYTLLKKKQPFHGFDKNNKKGAFLDNMLRKADVDYDKKADIKWNFTKFLVDRKGRVVARFEPYVTPEQLAEAVEKLLR